MINTLYEQFSYPLLDWYDTHGRKNLPWQSLKNPYSTWISEIMLQQTQVQTVIPYFTRFMKEFPTVHTLANANEDKVLSLWSGLGYYSRARNLHKTAKIISTTYEGIIPKELDLLINLPGIGASTAAAILSQSYNLPTAILDANVKRVLTRFFRIAGWTEQAATKKMLWQLANECMPKERCAEYTQAIMDLGSLCCTIKNPNCLQCPVQLHCQSLKHNEQMVYPTKKIKKIKPKIQQQFLVLYNQKKLVYLEKRPPSGLWGGLWCLPAIDKQQCPISHIKERYNLQVQQSKPLHSFKHQFSHFQLEIEAIAFEIKASGAQIAEYDGNWFAEQNLATLGLAKPTSLILSNFFLTEIAANKL